MKRASAAAAVVAAVAVTSLAGCGNGSTHPAAGQPSYRSVPPSIPAYVPSKGPLPQGVLVAVHLSGGPLRMMGGFGSMWVETHRDTIVYRVDPTNGKVLASIDTGHEMCGQPGVGFGRVWVGDCDLGTVVIDPVSNQVVARLHAGSLTNGFGFGRAWLSDPWNPRTLHRLAKLRSGGDVAIGGGYVWIADSDHGVVSQVDPKTLDVVHTYNAGVEGGLENYPAFADGALWVFAGPNKLWRVDPATHAVAEHDLHGVGGDDMNTFTVGAGSVWVRSTNVHRFDLRTLRPEGTYPANPTDGSGGFETIAFGSLWVSGLESQTVYRDRIR